MIHQYKNNGYDIVMDVNSGAVHVVDEMTATWPANIALQKRASIMAAGL